LARHAPEKAGNPAANQGPKLWEILKLFEKSQHGFEPNLPHRPTNAAGTPLASLSL
jgi:hypothetical protein